MLRLDHNFFPEARAFVQVPSVVHSCTEVLEQDTVHIAVLAVEEIPLAEVAAKERRDVRKTLAPKKKRVKMQHTCMCG